MFTKKIVCFLSELKMKRMAVYLVAIIYGISLVLSNVYAHAPQTKANETCTTCIKVNTTCYNLTHLIDLKVNFRNTIVISKMAVHAQKNTLYFSFEPQIDDLEYSKVGFVNLNDVSRAGVLATKSDSKHLFNFATFAIDESKGNIYVGGSNGIFLIDTNDNSVTPYSSRGDLIQAIFFKEHVHFTVYPELKIVQKIGDRFHPVKGFENEQVKDFVIDRHGVVYYIGNFGLFARKSNETVCLSDNAFFRGIVIDRYGDIFVWWIDGVYKVVKKFNFMDDFLVKVTELPLIGALTFDKDNAMLVTLGRSLFKFVQIDEAACNVVNKHSRKDVASNLFV